MAIVTGNLSLELEGASIATQFRAPLDKPLDIVLLSQPAPVLGIDLQALTALWGPLVSLQWSVEVEPLIIPLPAAVWLLGAAVAFLALRVRQ